MNWNAKFSMRAILSFLIVGLFLGGSGVTIVYHATTPQLIQEEITDDKTIKKYKELAPLDDSKLFNLWLGSVLGYAGSVITFWYKVEKTSDDVKGDLKKLLKDNILKDAIDKGVLTRDTVDKIKKNLE